MRWDGKGYDNNGNIIYELKNGQGMVKDFPISEIRFEGEIYNGKRRKGKEYIDNIIIFEGEYLNGKRNGKGKEFKWNGELEFEGEYLNDLKNGKGKIYYEKDKIFFEGEYLNGERNGKGKEYDEEGQLIFEGEYLNSKKWKGKINGIDYGYAQYYNNKLIIEGDYIEGKVNGKGKEYDEKGQLIFEGEYLNDKRWNGKINGRDPNYENTYFK